MKSRQPMRITLEGEGAAAEECPPGSLPPSNALSSAAEQVPDTHFIYVCTTYTAHTIYKITYFFLSYIENISDTRVFVSQ